MFMTPCSKKLKIAVKMNHPSPPLPLAALLSSVKATTNSPLDNSYISKNILHGAQDKSYDKP